MKTLKYQCGRNVVSYNALIRDTLAILEKPKHKMHKSSESKIVS